MKTLTDFQFPIYILEDDLTTTKMSFREYLETFWNDHTTTPEGVANRTQVRPMLLSSEGKLLDYSREEYDLDPHYYREDEERDEDGNIIQEAYIPEIKWGTFTWRGANGNGPFSWNEDVFDTYEDAYASILSGFERDMQTMSTNVPACSLSEEECYDGIIEEIMYRNKIDKPVAFSILKKMQTLAANGRAWGI